MPLRDAVRVWGRVAALSFGGPAGQIAVMHRLLVEETRWISEQRFLHALNFCMLLPGPEAQQLATYLGWLLHGTRGGLIAGMLFILPGFVSILALSLLYVSFSETTWVAALFYGLKPAVIAIVIDALLRVAARALKSRERIAIAGLSFGALFLFGVPFPIVIVTAAGLGWIGSRVRPAAFLSDGVVAAPAAPLTVSQIVGSIGVVFFWLMVWGAPLAVIAVALGPSHALFEVGLFFSKAATITFGGAYAVLAYIGQQAVEIHGWLTAPEMLDGLGLAETTPGPLIQVVQFVGFLGSYRDAAPLTPWVAGVVGSLLTTWVTFAPCFLWIFAFAPYVERLRSSRPLAALLSAITAAVVGVILNLTVWFSLHTLFSHHTEVKWGPVQLFLPDLATFDPWGAAIALTAAIALLRFRVGMPSVLLLGIVAGMAVSLARG